MVSEHATEQLLETLRRATGRPGLDAATPPVPLTGGYYAELLHLRLTDAPDELDHELVARLVPNPDMGAFEATVQSHVAEQGFPTPVVRLVVPPPNPTGRYVIVMDHVDGAPPLSDLGPRTILGRIPTLVRALPDQLAQIADRLHRLDAEPLAERLRALGGSIPDDVPGFLEARIDQAAAMGRSDLERAGRQLRADAHVVPDHPVAITHGDLHPLNVLESPDGAVLVDWSVAAVGHPAFTLAFTELLLANPPIVLPAGGSHLLRLAGRRTAARFLRTYRALAARRGEHLDPRTLEWHRRVHALRVLVELAQWDDAGTRPPGHPWVLLEPVARRILRLA